MKNLLNGAKRIVSKIRIPVKRISISINREEIILFWKKDMTTARIFKEEINNPAIWDTIVRDLELPHDTDEITVKAVSCDSESKRKDSQNRKKKNETTD
jgi:hypothetical protein